MDKVSKDAWVDAVIKAWKENGTVLNALNDVHHMVKGDNERFAVVPFDDYLSSIKGLRPKIRNAYLTTHVAVWIASEFHHASNCLFDGKYDLARRWLLSGKDTPAVHIRRKTLKREITSELGRAPVRKGSVSYVRELNAQRTNWRKCK